jgi:flagellin
MAVQSSLTGNPYIAAYADGIGLIADRLNSDDSFNSKFKATANGTDLEITAVDRENSALQATQVSDGAANETAGDVNRTELSFQDTPLKAGEEFTLNYTVAGTDKSVTLRVMSENSDLNTGDVISSGENDDGAVVALSASDVSDISETGLTGDDIAAAFADALTGGGSAFAGSDQGADFAATAADGTSVGVDATNATLTLDTTGAADDVAGSWTLPETDYQSLLNRVESASQTAIDAAAKFGSVQTRIEVQQDFLTSLTDNLESGIGTLVDADMAEESARLQALQVQQQLGTQALSIANSQPQNILSLFG